MSKFIQNISVGFVAFSVFSSLVYLLMLGVNKYSEQIGWTLSVVVVLGLLYLIGDVTLTIVKADK